MSCGGEAPVSYRPEAEPEWGKGKRMVIYVIRASFLLIFAGAGWQAGVFLNSEALASFWTETSPPPAMHWCILYGIGLYLIILAFEVAFGRVSVSVLSSVLFGLVAGFIVSNLAYSVISLLLTSQQVEAVGAILRLALSCVFCYLGITTIIKTRDKFNFIIPYVEFRREQRGPSPLLLDTSSIIDGRVADLAETRFLDVPLIIPRYVLDELQGIADSNDKLKRARGRRGLDILQRLQHSHRASIEIREDTENAESPVDSRLITLAKRIQARIVTCDSPLEKIAQLEGVDILNMNELANALRPSLIPGEEIHIELIRPGEENGQAVGYLDDGTMVVVEEAAQLVGAKTRVTVSSVLQRGTGRIIFGKVKAGA